MPAGGVDEPIGAAADPADPPGICGCVESPVGLPAAGVVGLGFEAVGVEVGGVSGAAAPAVPKPVVGPPVAVGVDAAAGPAFWVELVATIRSGGSGCGPPVHALKNVTRPASESARSHPTRSTPCDAPAIPRSPLESEQSEVYIQCACQASAHVSPPLVADPDPTAHLTR
jgi:hypothetical protein